MFSFFRKKKPGHPPAEAPAQQPEELQTDDATLPVDPPPQPTQPVEDASVPSTEVEPPAVVEPVPAVEPVATEPVSTGIDATGSTASPADADDPATAAE